MPPRHRFLIALATFLLLYGWYGVNRFSLGVDFTDEGAHLAWPMRLIFGERLFASEPALLLRPIIGGVSFLFQAHPSITLFEFRLIGWGIHLASFAGLAVFLFRLSGAPVQSLLAASIPLFVCNILGLVSPSYYTLSSDFLLMALSLHGLGLSATTGRQAWWHAAGGGALFIATLAHPALGVVAAIFLIRELALKQLATNLWRRKPSPTNIGALVFVAGWACFLLYILGTGAHREWIERVTLFRSFTVSPINRDPVHLLAGLITYPFRYSPIGVLSVVAALGCATAVYVARRAQRIEQAGRASVILALVLLASLIFTFSYDPDNLPVCFAMVALLVLGLLYLGTLVSAVSVESDLRFLLLLSGIGSVLCAASTYYFSPFRSWVSGILALPFAFAVGLTLLLKIPVVRRGPLRILPSAVMTIAVLCVARSHYREIYRDAAPPELTAEFRIPKLHRIKSTQERAQALDTLYLHLQPRLKRGETLLAFDHCPLLYYLFDAKPAYAMTWAARYTQSEASLRELDRDFRAKPLPRYAIRALVDTGDTPWSKSPRLSYDHYPLNATVLANYELERTIFPFEVWRLKSTVR